MIRECTLLLLHHQLLGLIKIYELKYPFDVGNIIENNFNE